MKKITFFVITMFTTLGAFAQFNQGRMLVGGTGEFSTSTAKWKDSNTTNTTSTTTTFSLSPDFGYFVIDRLAVGASVDFSHSKFNDKSNSNLYDYSSVAMGISPFVRYYLPMGVFFEGKFGVGTQKINYDDDSRETGKFSTSGLSLSAGYAIFLTDNVALEPSLGYQTRKFKDNDSEIKNIDSGLFLRIGFQIYLGNK